MTIVANVLWIIIIAALLIWLQVCLSRLEARWPGLLLPALHLLLAIAVGVGNVAYYAGAPTVESAVELTVEPIDTATPEADAADSGASIAIIGGADGPTAIWVTGNVMPGGWIAALYVFLLCNIPTFVDLAIYAIVRRKRGRRASVDRSRIQDL